ncbi:unnamed protein product [Prorocentrum cordatum]|uniref:Nuclear speckle splicing regulatory protein 1 N-terminal domain-containing protein n=1 Tax=Prorocentrum cordatum TaxID=2364126 RepID=A0ABN9WE08_9DINO|nr:unnamed protein product [Polarella glacialis]
MFLDQTVAPSPAPLVPPSWRGNRGECGRVRSHGGRGLRERPSGPWRRRDGQMAPEVRARAGGRVGGLPGQRGARHARHHGEAGPTPRRVKGECCISLHSGGRIRARADEPEALNLFADALQPVHEPASARRPKVVVRPSKEAEASGVAASNERILQPQVDAQDPGSPPSNVPVHERLYAHSTVQQQRLEQKRQQKVMEEDQAIQERMAEWNAIKQKKEERRAKDPSFNEDPRDFHERAQAFEIAKQLKVRQRREEMLMEEQMRLEEEREMSMPTRQVGANYDPYEAADRLYRNALNKGKPKEGGGESDFWEATRKRKTEEELQAEKKAQAEREAEEKRKEKERQKRDKLVEDGKKRKLRKQEEAEKQKAKAGETTEDQEKSQKAKENRRKSTACVQRLAKPKSPKKGSPGDPSSTSQDAKSSSPKGSEAKAKSPKSPRAARSASPSKEGRSQRLAELAEAGSPKCGRKSVLAKRAEKMQTLQDRPRGSGGQCQAPRVAREGQRDAREAREEGGEAVGDREVQDLLPDQRGRGVGRGARQQ